MDILVHQPFSAFRVISLDVISRSGPPGAKGTNLFKAPGTFCREHSFHPSVLPLKKKKKTPQTSSPSCPSLSWVPAGPAVSLLQAAVCMVSTGRRPGGSPLPLRRPPHPHLIGNGVKRFFPSFIATKTQNQDWTPKFGAFQT